MCWRDLNVFFLEKITRKKGVQKERNAFVLYNKNGRPDVTRKPAVTSAKNALCLRVSVFSTKVLIGDTIFTSPTGDGTAILPVHPSHAKV